MPSLLQTFLLKPTFRDAMSQKPGDKVGTRKIHPWWKRVRTGNNLAHRTMAADGMHTWVLSELAAVIARPLGITFQQSQ